MIIEQLAAATPKRVTLLIAAALLCAWEAKTGTHTWRQQAPETARYPGQMQAWATSWPTSNATGSEQTRPRRSSARV
ncbi:hypothetical protein [Pseudonocardia sp. GCM10023141]|uniref:hypothetical protein n=1 Tax=Pseudonocardia sp. GCM10023141 TaxID=3252653 RepID=UPI00360746D4